jgi:CrcB protein
VTAAGWLGFVVAAAAGAPVRYLVDGLVQERAGGAMPVGTFVVNMTGSFALGVLTGLALYHDLDPTLKTVLGTGGLGAYTTFSTFSFETVRLAEEGAITEALRNVVATLVVGLLAATAGLALTAAW